MSRPPTPPPPATGPDDIKPLLESLVERVASKEALAAAPRPSPTQTRGPTASVTPPPSSPPRDAIDPDVLVDVQAALLAEVRPRPAAPPPLPPVAGADEPSPPAAAAETEPFVERATIGEMPPPPPDVPEPDAPPQIDPAPDAPPGPEEASLSAIRAAAEEVAEGLSAIRLFGRALDEIPVTITL